MKIQKVSMQDGRYFKSRKKKSAGFSRVDLLTVIVLTIFLSGWYGLAHTGEGGRITRCRANMAMLGKAMQNYANDHEDMLPPAQVWLPRASVSWDSRVIPYLAKGSLDAGNDERFSKAERLFFCPSDPAPHNGVPRSYAMPANDMSPRNWPPGPNTTTGIGVWWNGQTVPLLLGNEAEDKPELLPGVKLTSVPDPANTLLLTELIDPQNIMGSVYQVIVWGVGQQQAFFKGNEATFHHGKFNYLMADGHVELLSALQTGTLDRSAGIWNIQKEN